MTVYKNGTANLSATFRIGQGYADLKATFTLPITSDLFAKFEIQDSEVLFAKLFVGVDAFANLKATFEVGQDSETLKAIWFQKAQDSRAVVQGVGVDVYVALTIVT